MKTHTHTRNKGKKKRKKENGRLVQWAKVFCTKCKPQLKMAVHRFALLTNKEANETKRAKKDIAKLLENGKE